MSLLAGFIGIDRHDDSRIRDLNGASRDATALWALLSDSLPDVNATRLIDYEASIAGVQELFSRTLGAAGEDDVVLLSFAGHGTPDHRLVLSDTQYAAVAISSNSRDDPTPGCSMPTIRLPDR